MTSIDLPRHLYVHVPFCARRCSYCDFAITVRRVAPVEDYIDAVAIELRLRAGDRSDWSLDTLYLGGGTPSKLGADGVRQLFDALLTTATLSAGAEVTLEANPEDVTLEAARAWRSAGINRLSLGAQSFDENVLKWMHRTHDAQQIVAAVDIARDAGLANISVDLIFALPAHVERSWAADLERVLQLATAHVSLYGLTIEPNTVLGRRAARRELEPCGEEAYETEFLLAHRMLSEAGYDHYEVSNFGLPGFRAAHNSSYWTGKPYEGVGPSAHRFDGQIRSWNIAPYAAWLTAVRDRRLPIADSESLSAANVVAEEVYLGLRTRQGVSVRSAEVEQVGRWVEAGWAILDGDRRLTLTASGWMRLDALAADLTLIRSR